MVGLVIVSYSEKLALGAMELAKEMVWDVPMAAAGGTKDGRLGTDVTKITTAINDAFLEDGVFFFLIWAVLI